MPALKTSPDREEARCHELLASGVDAAAIGRALASDPKSPALLAVRGLLRARGGDMEGADADFAAALAPKPRAWLFSLRSLIRERRGFIAEAVADMDQALVLESGVAAHHGRRAHLLFCRRRHDEALAGLARAIGLEPAEAQWYSQRAEVFFLIGRLEEARRDLEKARELSGEDPALDHRLAHVLVLLDRLPQALKVLRRDVPALTAYWTGYHALRRRSWKRAEASFKKAFDAAESPSLKKKFLFFKVLAQSLPLPLGEGRVRATKPEMRICSLGLFPPYTVTVEVAQALTRCDVVFNNLAGGETAEFLWSLAPRVRPATYDGMDDETPWADAIFEELGAKRTVAFATRGHAQVFGGLAYELIRRCGARIPCRCYAAVSSLDVLAAQASGWAGEPRELQAYDLPALERGAAVTADAPLFIYFYGGVGRERLAALRARLERTHPKHHPIRLYGPKYDDPPVESTLDKLDNAGPLHPSIVLYVPPAP